MDFSTIDRLVDSNLKASKKYVGSLTDGKILFAQKQIERNTTSLREKFRCLLTYQEICQHVASSTRVLASIADYNEMFKHIPNTIHTEVHPEGYYQVSLEVYAGFSKAFKGNSFLEKEFEHEVKSAVDALRPMGMIVNIKFFHYYL